MQLVLGGLPWQAWVDSLLGPRIANHSRVMPSCSNHCISQVIQRQTPEPADAAIQYTHRCVSRHVALSSCQMILVMIFVMCALPYMKEGRKEDLLIPGRRRRKIYSSLAASKADRME